jgi:hypothetical protein
MALACFQSGGLECACQTCSFQPTVLAEIALMCPHGKYPCGCLLLSEFECVCLPSVKPMAFSAGVWIRAGLLPFKAVRPGGSWSGMFAGNGSPVGCVFALGLLDVYLCHACAGAGFGSCSNRALHAGCSWVRHVCVCAGLWWCSSCCFVCWAQACATGYCCGTTWICCLSCQVCSNPYMCVVQACWHWVRTLELDS